MVKNTTPTTESTTTSAIDANNVDTVDVNTIQPTPAELAEAARILASNRDLEVATAEADLAQHKVDLSEARISGLKSEAELATMRAEHEAKKEAARLARERSEALKAEILRKSPILATEESSEERELSEQLSKLKAELDSKRKARLEAANKPAVDSWTVLYEPAKAELDRLESIVVAAIAKRDAQKSKVRELELAHPLSIYGKPSTVKRTRKPKNGESTTEHTGEVHNFVCTLSEAQVNIVDNYGDISSLLEGPTKNALLAFALVDNTLQLTTKGDYRHARWYAGLIVKAILGGSYDKGVNKIVLASEYESTESEA